ncbi:hypothetical protein BDY19DRAFT_464428 [Irpex rosettiformis]|uniref:Uncharacterized protein n=1 Tax=Irpex rosettiformis TaxID=378272 RepID=A0ACB8TSX3_9APHY|nr:hypothetical protein BDY19DRAFT_464428 [Irpex rosettiformis]
MFVNVQHSSTLLDDIPQCARILSAIWNLAATGETVLFFVGTAITQTRLRLLFLSSDTVTYSALILHKAWCLTTSHPPQCPSVRVFAALATTRIVLFTFGKFLLSILALAAVLDGCSVEALVDMAHSCSDFLLDIVLPTASTLLTQLLYILYSFVQAHTSTFFHIDFYHIASQFWEVIEPCIPSPPIQFCVLGRGIQCGSQLVQRPATSAIHDPVTRLVCHLADFTWSLELLCQ